MKHYAGVVVVCGDMILMGLERDGWSAFGGGCEEGEDIMATACREAEEESIGILNANWIKENVCACVVSKTPSNKKFFLFIAIAKEKHDVSVFWRRRTQAKRVVCLEKSDLKWIHLEKVKHHRLRRGFADDWWMIHMAVQHQLSIA